MIIAPVEARFVFKGKRLDAQYFCAPGVRAAETLSLLKAAGVKTVQLGDLGSVFHPNRFKRQLAAAAEPAMPFLRAFDVFEFLPQAADVISVDRTSNIDLLRVEEGGILLTRSGRNLGPAVMVDPYLSGFIPSDDLLRIRIEEDRMRYYVFAYLNSASGQSMLRLDKTGSVIDHLSAGQVALLTIPVFDGVVDEVVELTQRSHALRSSARSRLTSAIAMVDSAEPPVALLPARNGWTVRSTAVGSRIDAAFYEPSVLATRAQLAESGGVLLGDIATVSKPGGRYKTYYVGKDHGTPLLSGRNLLQVTPIGLKYISSRSIAPDAGYELRPGWICFQADGRAEERLGFPMMATSDRTGWLASGHVARVIPHSEEDAGWIWAAMASACVQRQIAALACGSVVDALYEDDLRRIALPASGQEVSAEVSAAWEQFAEAGRLESRAVQLIERATAEALAHG